MSEFWGWVILVIYVLGWLAFAPVLARVLAQTLTFGGEAPTKEDRIMGSIFALFLVWFWPLIIPIGLIYRRAFRPERKREDQS